MKGIKKLMQKYKPLMVIVILSIILLVIMFVIFLSLIFNEKKDAYGSRLDGIEDVEISDDTYETVETKLMDTGLVDKVNTRLQGKIVYIDVTFKSDVSSNDAKNAATTVLECFSEDELAYYDFEFILTQTEASKDVTIFNIMGTKHPENDEISWTKS